MTVYAPFSGPQPFLPYLFAHPPLEQGTVRSRSARSIPEVTVEMGPPERVVSKTKKRVMDEAM
jgi:hypothetical protein